MDWPNAPGWWIRAPTLRARPGAPPCSETARGHTPSPLRSTRAS